MTIVKLRYRKTKSIRIRPVRSMLSLGVAILLCTAAGVPESFAAATTNGTPVTVGAGTTPNIGNTVNTAISGASGQINQLAGTAASNITSQVGQLGANASAASIQSVISSQVSQLTNSITSTLNSSVSSALQAAGTNITSTLGNTLQNTIGQATQAATNAITSAIQSSLGSLTNSLTSSISSALGSALGSVTSAINSAVSSAVGAAGLAATSAVGTAVTATTYTAAQLAACGGCSCEDAEHLQTRAVIQLQENIDRQYITQKFTEHQNWLTNDYYKQWVMPAMKLMAEQLVTNGMNQMMALGAILDAKNQMETQRLLEQHMAEAHKDYQTTTEMCVMGTGTEHIASTERRSKLTAHILAKHGMDRQLGNTQSAAALGPDDDAVSRLDQVRSAYCNPNDNMKSVKYICGTGGPQARRNRDIDFARVMGNSATLDMDVSDTSLTNDEQDVFALQNYLYINHPFTRLTLSQMKTEDGQETWMAMRAVMAKHAVAENSFDNIIAMKTASGTDTTDNGKLMAVIFKRMGLSDDDAQRIIGGRNSATGSTSTALNRPSYYAMLQALSQSLYQSPSFFVNLYDTPANVQRKSVAMQAISLMLDRETYNSELREEAVLSQVLESEVIKAQSRHQNTTNNFKNNELPNPPAGP